MDMRFGIGFDVHKLVENRDLIIGGVKIPYEKGLLGHSDADVLTHSIMDALLGSCCLGDIGKHFPDTDEKYKGIDSIELLKEVNLLLTQKGFEIVNIDCVIIAEKPKMSPFIPEMIKTLSKALNILEEDNKINIKATTTEGLGFTGRGEGISAQVVCGVKSI